MYQLQLFGHGITISSFLACISLNFLEVRLYPSSQLKLNDLFNKEYVGGFEPKYIIYYFIKSYEKKFIRY